MFQFHFGTTDDADFTDKKSVYKVKINLKKKQENYLTELLDNL